MGLVPVPNITVDRAGKSPPENTVTGGIYSFSRTVNIPNEVTLTVLG